MDYKKYANLSVEGFADETKVLSAEGTFYHLLTKFIEEDLKNLHTNTKEVYKSLINNISKNDAYDQHGVLIEKSKVIDSIIDFNHHNIKEFLHVKNMIDKVIKSFVEETKIMTFTAPFSDILRKHMEENYKQFLIDQKNDLVEKIRVFAKTEAYDSHGVLVQTDRILTLIDDKEEKQKKSLKIK